MLMIRNFFVGTLFLSGVIAGSLTSGDDTFPAILDSNAPSNFAELWGGFDPREEPLMTEVLDEWEEDGVLLQIVRFHVGEFLGEAAKLAAVYGYPKMDAENGKRVPGLLQIHGGGQYADSKACLANAKRGYATLSIAWAGRISSPPYRVSPREVQLFWENKTEDPAYRVTTDWGKVDGYHAPGRNAGNFFPSIKPESWTLDQVASPRNSGWFLAAVAARRGLTFLEQQAQVDPDRLGVYGHSMGGKLTVMTASDPRVKAAAPSCGGISDLANQSALFRATLGDDVSLREISCPIIFLSPSNDFHGRIGDLPNAIKEIQSSQWRVTCSPHHNHQDTPPYEVATLLWFDQFLKGEFLFPRTPEVEVRLDTQNGPFVSVEVDRSKTVVSVDLYYTQQGQADESRRSMPEVTSRFWHHVGAENRSGKWSAALPEIHGAKPLWVFANVLYQLPSPVSGVGYYYGASTSDVLNVSSLLQKWSSQQLKVAGVAWSPPKASLLIEDFTGDWRKEWFTYRVNEWPLSTHKLTVAKWSPPVGASLSIDVSSQHANTLIIRIDDFVAEQQIAGDSKWQSVLLSPSDFRNHAGETMTDWSGVKRFKLGHLETLRSKPSKDEKPIVIGKPWSGAAPAFRNLRWQSEPTPQDP